MGTTQATRLQKKQKIDALIDTHIPEYHRDFFFQILEARQHNRIAEIEEKYIRLPVPIQVFIESDKYMDSKGILYPAIMDATKVLNNGYYSEAVLTGAIGAGKTTIALYTTAYQLYLLSCMRSPHAYFGLDASSEILFIFQSINAGLAKQVDYERFKSMIETSPYFTNNYNFDKNILSKLKFNNRIEVTPITGQETGAIGQNVIGGVIDELNFMAVIKDSTQSRDGGTYDQAVALYNSVSRRRKSRFMVRGSLPGVLCLVSSKRYPNQFTDVKIKEANKELEETGSTSIFVYDKATWEVMPADKFSGKWFDVYIGDDTKKPRVIYEDDIITADMEGKVLQVPVEYRKEFETDIMNALRDIAGVSTLATHPYMVNTDAVSACFHKDQESLLSRTEVDFVATQLEIYPERIINKSDYRWVHIDLGVTGDAAGFVMGHVTGFKDVLRGDIKETLPLVHIDCSLAIQPPKGGEIMFHKIRALIYKLSEIGVPIKWVSFDSFQSVDSIQLLKTQGYMCGRISMDRTTEPYDILKQALYDGRVELPEHKRLQVELASLERDAKKDKIDHPPNGSKDTADSLAGVVSGLTMRSEVWYKHGISPTQIPAYLKQKKENMAEADKEDAEK